jgi:hypothetical protein
VLVAADPAASDRQPGETDHGLDGDGDDQEQTRHGEHQGRHGPFEADQGDRRRIEFDGAIEIRTVDGEWLFVVRGRWRRSSVT